MGRGGRSLAALALSPVPPSHDPLWLDAFVAFEHAEFHYDYGQVNCDIPTPFGAPRFVVVNKEYLSADFEVHTFNYYTNPEDFLKKQLLTLRTPSVYASYALEYLPDRAAFGTIELAGGPLGIFGSSIGHVVADVPPSNQRVSRLQVLATTYDVPVASGNASSRFVCITRGIYGDARLTSLSNFADVCELGSSMAFSIGAFEAFYDLDVSDQPIPIRFTLRYADAYGAICEVAEPV